MAKEEGLWHCNWSITVKLLLVETKKCKEIVEDTDRSTRKCEPSWLWVPGEEEATGCRSADPQCCLARCSPHLSSDTPAKTTITKCRSSIWTLCYHPWVRVLRQVFTANNVKRRWDFTCLITKDTRDWAKTEFCFYERDAFFFAW